MKDFEKAGGAGKTRYWKQTAPQMIDRLSEELKQLPTLEDIQNANPFKPKFHFERIDRRLTGYRSRAVEMIGVCEAFLRYTQLPSEDKAERKKSKTMYIDRMASLADQLAAREPGIRSIKKIWATIALMEAAVAPHAQEAIDRARGGYPSIS